MSARAIAVAACVLACAGSASAQGASDVLYVTGQADFLRSGSGGSGGADWVRSTERHGVQLGAVSGSHGEAWWTYGRAGGFVRQRRVILSGMFDLGGGAQAGNSFGYRRFMGQAAVPIAGGRVLLETEGQRAQMAADVRHILRLGVRWQLSPAVAAGGSYYLNVQHGSRTPAVSARIDIERGRMSMLAGAVATRSDRTSGLIGRGLVGQRLINEVGGMPLTSTEVFAGCGVRARSSRVQVVANVAQPAGSANRLLVSLTVPLGSARSGVAADPAARRLVSFRPKR